MYRYNDDGDGKIGRYGVLGGTKAIQFFWKKDSIVQIDKEAFPNPTWCLFAHSVKENWYEYELSNTWRLIYPSPDL